jgi:hypothetical protein
MIMRDAMIQLSTILYPRDQETNHPQRQETCYLHNKQKESNLFARAPRLRGIRSAMPEPASEDAGEGL